MAVDGKQKGFRVVLGEQGAGFTLTAINRVTQESFHLSMGPETVQDILDWAREGGLLHSWNEKDEWDWLVQHCVIADDGKHELTFTGWKPVEERKREAREEVQLEFGFAYRQCVEKQRQESKDYDYVPQSKYDMLKKVSEKYNIYLPTMEAMHAQFSAFASPDGFLDENGFRGALPGLFGKGQTRGGSSNRYFLEADTIEKDQKVDFDEFVNWLITRHPKIKDMTEQPFRRFITTGSSSTAGNPRRSSAREKPRL